SGSKLRDLTSSPMAKITAPVFTPGQRPSIANMPNMADIAAMMENTIGGLAAGTMGRTVTSLAFSSDGRTLAIGGVESKTNIAAMMNSAMSGQMGGQRQKGQKKGSPQPDPNDLMKDLKVETVGQVRLWDVSTGSELGAIKGHGRGVTKVAFSRDGKLLASAGTDNTIKIWDVGTRAELRTLTDTPPASSRSTLLLTGACLLPQVKMAARFSGTPRPAN